MVNEELKTFISKMRAAGKTDAEITAELKTAGWAEVDIVSALNPQPILPVNDQSPVGKSFPVGASPASSPEIQAPNPLKKWLWIGVGAAGLILILAAAVIAIKPKSGSSGETVPMTSTKLPTAFTPTASPVINSDSDEELEPAFYESSDIGNASTVKIRPPKGWYGSVWGSISNLAVVLKPKGYTVKEYSFPFIDINIVQVGTKSVSVIKADDNALLEKWITNNDVLPPKNDNEYSVNVISREFRKFNIGYGFSNAYYVEFDLFLNEPQNTKDGPVNKLKFARILVEAKHPNFGFDIKIVDTLENWNKNKDIIYRSLATLTGEGSAESGEGL